MREISRRTVVQGAAALGIATALGATRALAANNPPKIGIVGKVKIPWFDNVEKGVLKAGQDLGVDASIINPTTDDPAQQVRAIEDLIAKKVDVIGVVPNDGKALEPVLKRAQDAGIKVVMNESPGQKNADWDIELIQNKEFGEAHLKPSRKRSAASKYVVFVGGLAACTTSGPLCGRLAKGVSQGTAGRRSLRRLNGVDDTTRPRWTRCRQIGPQGLPDLWRERSIGAGNAVSDRDQIGKGDRHGPFIPIGTQADEIWRNHTRLCGPDRLGLCDGRPWQDIGRAPRSRTASICRVWDPARSHI
jgi:simple sugar transport system substrate-binding protein